jgi:multisubunit Na+/H+ antiporter MnhF subunit
MNAAYIHLVLNHFPPIVGIAALIVLVLGALWRNDGVLRAAFVLLLVGAAAGGVAYWSGDGAADIVKGLEGVNSAAIGPHDEAAGLTLWTYIAAGVVALFALIKYRAPRAIARWAATLTIILAFLATASSLYTAMLGGRIHHPETQIRAR